MQTVNINFAGQTGKDGRLAEHLNRPGSPSPRPDAAASL